MPANGRGKSFARLFRVCCAASEKLRCRGKVRPDRAGNPASPKGMRKKSSRKSPLTNQPTPDWIHSRTQRRDERKSHRPPSSRLVNTASFSLRMGTHPPPAFFSRAIFPSRAPSPSPFAPPPCRDCAWDSGSARVPGPRFPTAALRERWEFRVPTGFASARG
jgi:hypothetical protein